MPVAREFLDPPARHAPRGLGCGETALRSVPGDVTAYVSAYRLDRFTELRNRIKEVARKTAAAIYEATRDEKSKVWAYESVAVVAHSLGSVIAYDALNALLVEDTVSAERRDVAMRTRLLLTFGSPLEKTELAAPPSRRGRPKRASPSWRRSSR